MSQTLLKDAMRQLAGRWAQAHFEFDTVKSTMGRVKLVLFSLVEVYDFDRYAKTDSWLSEDVFQVKPPEDLNFFEYGFDEEHQPVIVRKYINKELYSVGVFLWEESNWEYVEYSLSQVCSRYYSIIFRGGKKDKFMSLRLNGGVLPFAEEKSTEEIAQRLLQNSFGFFADISIYNYDNNVLTTANSLRNLPGIGDYFTTDYYKYDTEGNLYKITSYNSEEQKQVIYIKLSGRSARSLIQTVAQQMTSYLTSAIAQSGYKNKLSSVILSYKYCYSYWPDLSFISEDDMLNDMREKEAIFPMGELYSNEHFHLLATEKLQEDFAELEQFISQNDDHKQGEKMLLETAKILTQTKLNNVVPVADDFFVYPFDWSLHASPEKKLLKACGASGKLIKEWEKAGWLR